MNLHLRISGKGLFWFQRASVKATAMVDVTVPDPAVRTGRQLSACWGPGNSLLLHVKKSKAEQQQQQGSGGEETEVHEV